MLPSVSVVIPCYNVEGYAERAVVSALCQTVSPMEIICIDDGSTDGTLAVLRQLETQSPGIVRVMTGPNAGAPAARNRGLAKAAGEYVQFLDADDTMDPTKLERQLAIAATEERRPDFLAGASRWHRLSGHIVEQTIEDSNPWLALLERGLGITSANLWRRDAVLAVGGWGETWKSSQEAELMLRMLQNKAVVAYDAVPSATIYERQGSITHNPQFAHRERHVRLRVEALAHVRREGILSPLQMEKATNIVFKSIRWLSPLSLGKAAEFHDLVIPRPFSPPPGASGSQLYPLVYRALGFRAAEVTSAAVSQVRSTLRSIIRRQS